jgi:hypothetical protein
MTKGIYSSREKDYSNPYRKMVFESLEEMNAVVGTIEENSFINQQQQEFSQYKKMVLEIIKQLIISAEVKQLT